MLLRLLPSRTKTNWGTEHWNTATKHWQQHIARTHAKRGTTLGCLSVLTSWTTFCWNMGIKGFIRGMSIWIWKDAITPPQTSGIRMTQHKLEEGCSSTTKRFRRCLQTYRLSAGKSSCIVTFWNYLWFCQPHYIHLYTEKSNPLKTHIFWAKSD